MMKKINLDHSTSFELELEIHGDVAQGTGSKIYFNINHGDFLISIPAKKTGNGVYKVDVPAMANLLKPQEYDFEVSVIIDGKYFTPISDKVKFFQEVKPVVKIKNDNNSEVKITIKEKEEESSNIVSENLNDNVEEIITEPVNSEKVIPQIASTFLDKIIKDRMQK